MEGHEFNLEGGAMLTQMGATWFVSYAYYEKIDNTHLNWKKVSTTQTRISTYNRSRYYHKYWLQEVVRMNETKLNRNSILLSAAETKVMAKRLLEI